MSRLRQKGLALALGALFVVSWCGHLLFSYRHQRQDALDHGERLGFWSWSFWDAFLDEMFANWQSEFLQLLSMVVLGTALYYVYRGKHSPESRGSAEDA